jgi:hypothetical protein
MRLSYYPYEALLSVLVSLAHADYISPLNYGQVFKRQSCPTNYYSCADMGSAFAGTCCVNGEACALDADNQPACCPST